MEGKQQRMVVFPTPILKVGTQQLMVEKVDAVAQAIVRAKATVTAKITTSKVSTKNHQDPSFRITIPTIKP